MPDEPKPPKRRRRPRKSGTIDATKTRLWAGIEAATDVLLTTNDQDLTLRAVHALSQATGQYSRLVESSDLADRVSKLEERLNTGTLRRVG